MKAKEEELKEEIRSKEISNGEHFERCKFCKPDDYCSMEMLLKHQLEKLRAELKGIAEGKRQAYQEVLKEIKQDTEWGNKIGFQLWLKRRINGDYTN